MDYKLVLDVMVSALLLVTIVYAWVLNQRLSQLRRNRDDLAKVVASFNDATARAEAGIPKLRKASEEGLKLLQPILQQVDAAHKDGFNSDNSLQENVDGRLDEMTRLLKELKSNGCQVQWD